MPDTNKYVFYVSMFFPFIAPALVDMGSRRKRNQEMANNESINDYGNDDGSDGDSEDEDYGYIVKDDELRSSSPHINNNQFDSSSKEHLHVENGGARGKAKKNSISLYFEFFANIYHFIRTPIVKFFYHQVSLLSFIVYTAVVFKFENRGLNFCFHLKSEKDLILIVNTNNKYPKS